MNCELNSSWSSWQIGKVKWSNPISATNYFLLNIDLLDIFRCCKVNEVNVERIQAEKLVSIENCLNQK